MKRSHETRSGRGSSVTGTGRESAALSRMGSIYAWFFEDQSLYPLVVCRIGLGLVIFSSYIFYLPELEVLYSPAGIAHYMRNIWWTDLPETTYLLIYFVTLASSLAFAFGFRTRLAGLVLFGTHNFLYSAAYQFEWGWTYVVNAFLIYVLFSRAGTLASVDSWQESRWNGERNSIAASGWPMRLIQIHLTVLYMAAAWHRIDDPAWLRGEMVFEALNSTFFGRFPGVDWMPIRSFLEVMTYVTLVFEFFAPVGLWIPRIRTTLVVVLITFHVGLELTTTTGWWQFMMVVLLFCFLPREASRSVVQPFDNLVGRICSVFLGRREVLSRKKLRERSH